MNEKDQLKQQLIEALANLFEAAREFEASFNEYERAWREVKPAWEEATRSLERILKKVDINESTIICSDYTFYSVRLGHWPEDSPPRPRNFMNFCEEFIQGLKETTEKFRNVGSSCQAALPVLRSLEETLAPEAAMNVLAQGGEP